MKKIIALLLAVLIVFAFCVCGHKNAEFNSASNREYFSEAYIYTKGGNTYFILEDGNIYSILGRKILFPARGRVKMLNGGTGNPEDNIVIDYVIYSD